MIEGAIKIIGDRLKIGFTTGKGASGNELAKYKADMKHFRRWQAVKRRLDQGATLVDACYEAADELQGTFAKGGEQTVKLSYKVVEDHLPNVKERMRYYNAMREVRYLTDT